MVCGVSRVVWWFDLGWFDLGWCCRLPSPLGVAWSSCFVWWCSLLSSIGVVCSILQRENLIHSPKLFCFNATTRSNWAARTATLQRERGESTTQKRRETKKKTPNTRRERKSHPPQDWCCISPPCCFLLLLRLVGGVFSLFGDDLIPSVQVT